MYDFAGARIIDFSRAQRERERDRQRNRQTERELN